MRGLPQRAGDKQRRGHLDRRRLAAHDDGQRGARPVLARGSAARNDRPSRVARGDRGRVLDLPHADGAVRIEAGRPRGRRSSPISQFLPDDRGDRLAADGVSCSLCHQIGKEKLGTRESFVGGFVIGAPNAQGERLEFGPYAPDAGHARIMRTFDRRLSSPPSRRTFARARFAPPATRCITKALGPGGKEIGELPEQVPYQEWLHSEYREKRSCQSCHMPVVQEDVRDHAACWASRGRGFRGTCSWAATSSCSEC